MRQQSRRYSALSTSKVATSMATMQSRSSARGSVFQTLLGGSGNPDIKIALHSNTDAAIADGVFGVPTFTVDRELLWGDDATDMFIDYLSDRAFFGDPELLRLSNMPMGLVRLNR